MNDEDLKAQLDRLEARLDELHDVFFKLPKGVDPKNEKTFYQKLVAIVDAWENGSWAMRMVAMMIGAVLFIGGAVSTITGWTWWPWK